jgi:ribose transport system ATP-binding protein
MAHGTAVLYISHRLDEVQQVADKVTVLRDGKMVGTYPGKTLNQMDMARLMVGRELAALYPEKTVAPSDIPMLSVRNATVPGYAEDVSFTVHKGEILGFAGMIGAGRTELFEGIIGLRPATATVELKGKPVHFHSQRAAIDAGIGYLTEDARARDCCGSAWPQTTLSALGAFIRPLDGQTPRNGGTGKGRRDLRHPAADLGVKAGQLSGSNQRSCCWPRCC